MNDRSSKRDDAPDGRNEKAEAYFRKVSQAFLKAELAACGPIDKFYTIGGFIVHLRFGGRTLVPLLSPSFEHLAAPPSSPHLTVFLWDGQSTGISAPSPPWDTSDYAAQGEIRGFNTDRFDTVYQVDTGILNMLDSEANTAAFWVRDHRRLRYYEIASPLRLILFWWMRRHGRQMAHAAALGLPGGGVLMPGRGNSGKTTASLACLRSRVRCAGDNFVLLGREASGPFAYSLYNSMALELDNLQTRFPFLLPRVSNPERLDKEKALVFIHQHEPDFCLPRIPVKAILLPRITGEKTTNIRKESSARSLMSLVPHSILNFPKAGQADFQYLADYVKPLPSYVLELGTDISRTAAILTEFLSEFE